MSILMDVPVGYKGKLRDMNLQEGDVVENTISGFIYTMKKDRNGCLACNGYGVNPLYSQQDYILISRAASAQYGNWTGWQLSKIDGTVPSVFDDVEKIALPDTEQYVYRGRMAKPVSKVEAFEVGGVTYTGTVTNGELVTNTIKPLF